MDFFKILIFIEIAKTGNLTQASNNLNMSQPAMSSQLRIMEDKLGYNLFYRTTKGMVLTTKGKLLINDANEIINAVNSFDNKAKAIFDVRNESISIGLNTDPNVLKIDELLKLLNNENKDNTLKFVQTKSEDFVSDIDSNKIQAGFFYGELQRNDLEIMNIKSFPIHILIPTPWIKKNVKPFNFESISNYPWIWTSEKCPFSIAVMNFLKTKKIKIDKIHFIDDEKLIGTLVEKEIGCSFLAEPIALSLANNTNISTFQIPNLSVNLNFGYKKEQKKRIDEIKLIPSICKIWNII